MEDCTQVIDISSVGFDITDLGRVKVGTLTVKGVSYDIYKGENVIGRDELSDIVLRSSSVSSRHAVLEVEDWDTHLLFDCGSTNKTRLGKMFLKPNVRYNLQGGEDIMFADLKAKYVKLVKPDTNQNDEDSVSDAGSESILDSVPVDLEADLDVQNIQPQNCPQAHGSAVEDKSQNDSSIFSDLNDSSLLDENKQKAATSKPQIVDASDDSTDEEVDFIPPSQTVKEFVSSRKAASKIKHIKGVSGGVFGTEVETHSASGNKSTQDETGHIFNTQEQEMLFMTEKPQLNPTCISLETDTQGIFNSEVRESQKPEGEIIVDQTIFDAETQDIIAESQKIEETGLRNRASRDIFDAETEMPEDLVCSDIEMSELALSNVLTQPNSSNQKLNSSITDVTSTSKVKGKETFEVTRGNNADRNIVWDLVKCIKLEKVKEEVTDPNYTEHVTDQNNTVNQFYGNHERETALSDMTNQANVPLNAGSETCRSLDLDNEDISSICTQVNTSLISKPMTKTIVKEEISIKYELDDGINIAAEETQLNVNILEKTKFNQKQKISRTSHTRPVENISNIEAEETQPNLHLYSFFSESRITTDREADISDLQTQLFHQNDKTATTEDSDSTDVEEDSDLLKDKIVQDQRITRCQTKLDRNVEALTTNNDSIKTNELEIDESSNQSDSILASVPLDPELLEQEALQSGILNPSKSAKENVKGREINCESVVKSSQNICDEDLKKHPQEMTMGDMDICSTVGDGTYVSACGSIRKAQSGSKIKSSQPKTSCKEITPLMKDKQKISKSKNLFLDQIKASETLNTSMVFNEPCGSSTPFRPEERIIEDVSKKAVGIDVKTPPRGIIERMAESPDLPCTDEILAVASETPERQKCDTPILESSKPLALNRTPRARKLSRKLAATLEDVGQKGVAVLSLPSLLNKKTTTDRVLSKDRDSFKEEDFVNFQENRANKKKAISRPSIGLKKDCTGTGNKYVNNPSNEIFKKNVCVKKLSINLCDINHVKSKTVDTKRHDINKHTSVKGTKNIEDEESNLETQSVFNQKSTDRQQKTQVTEEECEGAIKNPHLKKNDNNGELINPNQEINESHKRLNHELKSLSNIQLGQNTTVAELSAENHLIPSSIVTCNINVSNDCNKNTPDGKKLQTVTISDDLQLKRVMHIENTPSEDKQSEKKNVRATLRSKSTTPSKSGQPIEEKGLDYLGSSIVRVGDIDETKDITLSKEELSKRPNQNSKPGKFIDVTVDPTDNDINKHVIPPKRPRNVQKPSNSISKKSPSVDLKYEKKNTRANLGSKSPAQSKSGQPTKEKDLDTFGSSILRLRNSAEIKEITTLSKKEFSKSPKRNSKPEECMDVDMDQTNDEMNEHVIPPKRPRNVEKPCNLISEKSSTDNKRCEKRNTRANLGSKSSTPSKSGHLDTFGSSIVTTSISAAAKETTTLSIKELSKSPKKSSKREEITDVDMEQTDEDMNDHVLSSKIPRNVEKPCHSISKKLKEKENIENKGRQSVKEIKTKLRDTVKLSTPNDLDIKYTNNNRRQSKRGEKLEKAKEVEKEENKVYPTENLDIKNTISVKNIKRSSRRKKEDNFNSIEEINESKEENKSLDEIRPALQQKNKKQLKNDSTEEPYVNTKRSGRKRKEEAVKHNIKKDKRETESKLLKEFYFTSNQRSNTKSEESLLDGSVEIKKPKVNPEFKSIDASKTSNIVGDHSEKSTRGNINTRSRIKPARFRDNEDISVSDTSSVGIDKGSSLTKRQKGRKVATRRESDDPTTPDGDKTESNDEHNVFIPPSKSTLPDSKNHSELFKTPVVEDRGRSRIVRNEKSRSRSRSDSSQSSRRSDTSSLQSPRRSGGRGKRVLFTSGLINPIWESHVKKLGGSVVDCPLDCSLLVADKVRRTVKFLCVLGQGKPIVSPDWLTQSWQCTSFLEPLDQLLVDKEAEEKFKFSMSRTIQVAKNQPLLKGFHIYVTPSVKPPPEDIKSIVECCGGEYVEKVPSKWPENIVIISHVDDKSLWRKFKVKGLTPPIVAAEMLLIGVLQHKLEIEPHRLS